MVSRCKNCGGLISAGAIALVTMSDEEKRACECTAESFPRKLPDAQTIVNLQLALAKKISENIALKRELDEAEKEIEKLRRELKIAHGLVNIQYGTIRKLSDKDISLKKEWEEARERHVGGIKRI